MKKDYSEDIVPFGRGMRFLIDIRFLQHNSWQGSIQRMDTGEKIFFRSELELLMLMGSATEELNSRANEDQSLRKWKDSKGVAEMLNVGD
ncbi:hypothetical protein SAMN05192551_101134 [Tindallia magadiensis]|uniref:Uncharacterized protein n=1 Tax=Tindallia magadiensis TaxID=69895 RepID=A0A1I3ADQ3_9FIRM|nr:hypothetical protein [Tindallia magadiensis]SFH47849.1 hypothetical protein SAMN05192551_101134 [Tindallia magadiensis]